MKSIASFNGDLASLTAPPFILSPVSLTEYCKFWAENHTDFIAIAQEQDPERRFIKVVKWFLGTLKEQYYSRNEQLGSEKKPLNPFLGEVFTGQWKDAKNGTTNLVSEQVSHHPPVTAFNIWNEQNQLNLEGYVGIKATLSTQAISVRQYGHSILTLQGFDGEQYLITLPALHIEGILFGKPYVELDGKSYIQSTSGYKATIEYSGKGYFSGKKNTFKALVVKNAFPKDTLYTIKGQWSGTSKIAGPRGEEPFLDATKQEVLELQVKPIENQSSFETRKAWLKVAEAIKSQDFQAIHNEKSEIEVNQRIFRKREERDGKEWPRRWFEAVRVADEPWYVKLSEDAGVVAGSAHSSSSTDTKKADPTVDTNWRFSKEKYLESPIRPDVNESGPDVIAEYLTVLEQEEPVAGEESIKRVEVSGDGFA